MTDQTFVDELKSAVEGASRQAKPVSTMTLEEAQRVVDAIPTHPVAILTDRIHFAKTTLLEEGCRFMTERSMIGEYADGTPFRVFGAMDYERSLIHLEGFRFSSVRQIPMRFVHPSNIRAAEARVW
ncbi:hypothetical protein [Candidatus Macondimonas diazotrophica]|jgi:hypothetical protein|uniref:Uncharacterized protein n=1 Tax=Candidatus Macondimonas diazotrophica TaxID=2305248 RepID=A0A4Z0F7C3_9GAMM|nr:hypothetical protein [Candidatus Macondimonas diazotrophica]TFZ81573.1 hypothetical protein E4680_11770 [Candidatus Macondimonas diazotrophica]